MRALGIYREPEYSPGKVDADAAILDAVLAELRAKGWTTSARAPSVLSQGELPGIEAEVVLAMCQSQAALASLGHIEQSGIVVINRPEAIRNCYRVELSRRLEEAGIPVPESRCVSTRDKRIVFPIGSNGAFVKRGDFHALTSRDVLKVSTAAELKTAIMEFAKRGIESAVVQEAIAGEVIKFYGVGAGSYFACANALPPKAPLIERLAEIAIRAASALELEVWGGDAVLSHKGPVVLDFNDWPSFSAVRNDAAKAIATRVADLLNRSGQRKGVDSSSL